VNAATRATLAHHLRCAGLALDAIAAAGGGVWCFGSRASGCARPGSDWDVLIVTRAPVQTRRLHRVELDVVQLGLHDLDAWAGTELAGHIARYGVRLDDGAAIALRSAPQEAAGRKRAVVAARALYLDRVWAALQPAQRDYRALRLRRDLQRAALLAGGAAVPPTALLDAAWDAASLEARRGLLGGMPRQLARAITALR
jgi:nucleotidyltransferase-like protein